MTDLLRRASNYLKHRQENQVETNSFKENHPFLKRKEESDRILAKYPDRVPVICERITKRINQLDRKKYLCPGDLSLANFMYVIRKRMKLSPEKAIYLFVNGKMCPTSALLSQIYHENKDEDGFLYIKYDGESTFG